MSDTKMTATEVADYFLAKCREAEKDAGNAATHAQRMECIASAFSYRAASDVVRDNLV